MCSRFPDPTYLRIFILLSPLLLTPPYVGEASLSGTLLLQTVYFTLVSSSLKLCSHRFHPVHAYKYTHTRTYACAHTCPRDLNGICPEVCAKTGGSSSLHPGTEGLAGFASQLRVADNISTWVFYPTPSKGAISPKTSPGH